MTQMFGMNAWILLILVTISPVVSLFQLARRVNMNEMCRL